MPLDVTKYKPYLDGFDLTDHQKTAMIEALWSIAEEVSDLAYGVHSTQLIRIANDNDSTSDFSVIEFFHIAANDPILNDLAAELPGRTADNDNAPQSDQQKKEAGT